MTTTAVEVDRTPAEVFAVVTDPTTYPDWLVGARAVRRVDDDWPRPGSSFGHVIGVPPVVVPGSTTVRVVRAPDERGRGGLLELGAGMGPLGEARVRFRLRPADFGRTVVEVDEEFTAGPARWTWRLVRPLVAALVWGRNAVSLDALRRRLEPT